MLLLPEEEEDDEGSLISGSVNLFTPTPPPAPPPKPPSPSPATIGIFTKLLCTSLGVQLGELVTNKWARFSEGSCSAVGEIREPETCKRRREGR